MLRCWGPHGNMWYVSLNFCVQPIISDFFWGIGFLSDLLQEVQGHNMALFELATGGIVMVSQKFVQMSSLSGDDQALATDAL